MPTTELRRCPSCGSTGFVQRVGFVNCTNITCYLFKFGLPEHEWQTRPLEDALQMKLDVAESKIARLEKKNQAAEEDPNKKNPYSEKKDY